jgi:hypothetical protein
MGVLKEDSAFSEYSDRDPSALSVLRFMEYGHLRPGAGRDMSTGFASLARRVMDSLGDDPELAVALRKLREAKDCAVGLAAVQERG